MARTKNIKRGDPALATTKPSKRANIVEARADSPSPATQSLQQTAIADSMQRNTTPDAPTSPHGINGADEVTTDVAQITTPNEAVQSDAPAGHVDEFDGLLEAIEALGDMIGPTSDEVPADTTSIDGSLHALGMSASTAPLIATSQLLPITTQQPLPNLIFPSFDIAQHSLFRRDSLQIEDDDIDTVRINKPTYVAQLRDSLLMITFKAAPATHGSTTLTLQQQAKWPMWQGDAQIRVDSIRQQPSADHEAEAHAWWLLEEVIRIHDAGFRCTTFDAAAVKATTRIDMLCTVMQEYAIVRECVFEEANMHDFYTAPQAYADEKVRLMLTNFTRARRLGSKSGARSATQGDGLGRTVQRRNTKQEYADLKEARKQQRKADRASKKAANAAMGDQDEDEEDEESDEDGVLEVSRYVDLDEAAMHQFSEEEENSVKRLVKKGSSSRKSTKRSIAEGEDEERELDADDFEPAKQRKSAKKGSAASKRVKRKAVEFEEDHGDDHRSSTKKVKFGDDGRYSFMGLKRPTGTGTGEMTSGAAFTNDTGAKKSAGFNKRAAAPSPDTYALDSESDLEASNGEDDASDWEQTKRSKKG